MYRLVTYLSYNVHSLKKRRKTNFEFQFFVWLRFGDFGRVAYIWFLEIRGNSGLMKGSLDLKKGSSLIRATDGRVGEDPIVP